MPRTITLSVPSIRRPDLSALRSQAHALANRAIDRTFDAAVRLESELAARKAAAQQRVKPAPTEY